MSTFVMAFDSFKGCLDSEEAGKAAALGVRDVYPDADCRIIRIADGGEGMAEAIGESLGLNYIEACVTDPLMRDIVAGYYFDTHRRVAYIDLAATSGITLLSDDELNPWKTTTWGTGLMLKDAIAHGARKIVLGLGGSATNDAGLGALQALGMKIFLSDTGLTEHPASGGMLSSISRVDLSGLKATLEGVEISLACDVSSPFIGENGAVKVFSRQKGADSGMMDKLESGMANVASILRRDAGIDVSFLPGAGAAGGAGGGFAAAGANICNGVELVIKAVGLAEALSDACLCITGEGCADHQTLMGKAPSGVLKCALTENVPVMLLAGRLSDVDLLEQAGFAKAACINPPDDYDLRPHVAAKRIRQTVARLLHNKENGNLKCLICIERC